MGDATCPRSNSIVLSTWARLASCGHGNMSICYTACVCCMSHQQEQANCREKRPLAHSISTLHPIRSLKHASSLLSGKTHHLQCKTGHIGQTCPTLALLFYCLIAYCNKRSVPSQTKQKISVQTTGCRTDAIYSNTYPSIWRTSARLGHLYWSLCVYSVPQHARTMCSTHRERFTQQVLRQIEEELLEGSDPWKRSYCDK